MKTKHTPGEWHAGMKPGPIIYGPKGEQVCDLRGDLLPKDEAQANTRLIAAAPDLLEALSDISAWLVCPALDKNTLELMQAKATKVLSKATTLQAD